MTKFDEFVNEGSEEVSKFQKLDGNYGCQYCEQYTPVAYFDESKGEMFWYCSQKHKSTIQVG
jgi:hypothetical protein